MRENNLIHYVISFHDECLGNQEIIYSDGLIFVWNFSCDMKNVFYLLFSNNSEVNF